MKYLLFLLLPFCQLCYGQTDDTKINSLIDQAANYENAGDFDNAIKINLEIFNMKTKYSCPSANTIAGIYCKKGDFENEVVWAQKAISIEPKFSYSYINLGNGYAGQNNLDKAVDCFKQADKLDPKSSYPPYSLGVIEEMKGNYKNAIIFYQQSVDRDSTFENGYYNLAAAYANLHDFASANKNILKVLQLDPNAKDAQEMHERIIEDSGQH